MKKIEELKREVEEELEENDRIEREETAEDSIKALPKRVVSATVTGIELEGYKIMKDKKISDRIVTRIILKTATGENITHKPTQYLNTEEKTDSGFIFRDVSRKKGVSFAHLDTKFTEIKNLVDLRGKCKIDTMVSPYESTKFNEELGRTETKVYLTLNYRDLQDLVVTKL